MLCSLQLPHLPITVSHVGQRNVVEPVSRSPFPQDIHRSAFFIGCAEYNIYYLKICCEGYVKVNT